MPLYNVRIRSQRYSFKKTDGRMTNDWTFLVDARSPKAAGRKVIEEVYGGPDIAQYYVKSIEIWQENRGWAGFDYQRWKEN